MGTAKEQVKKKRERKIKTQGDTWRESRATQIIKQREGERVPICVRNNVVVRGRGKSCLNQLKEFNSIVLD